MSNKKPNPKPYIAIHKMKNLINELEEKLSYIHSIASYHVDPELNNPNYKLGRILAVTEPFTKKIEDHDN